MKEEQGAYSDTQISDAWNVLFQASEELKNLIRRQPARVIDFQKFKERRMAQPNLHEERKA
jgi:hypothetical protein